jgi:hypothetical protein
MNKKAEYIDNVNNTEYTFKDNMRITKRLKVYGAGKTKNLKKLDKKINIYINGYMEKLTSRKLEKPSGSDCWFCALGNDKGSLGEVTHDKNHIISHMKEKYYVPSLLTRAVDKIPVSKIAMHCIGYWFKFHEERMQNFEDIAQSQIRTSLKRYLRSQLGLAR